ncbi:MAG: recombinase family protein [Pseudomonadota bacterium]
MAYLRVSTTREQQELGISAQRAAIESWAGREGVEVCAIFEEEVSGGAPLEKRPFLLQAIAALGEHGAALLVVQRLDRFSRDPLGAAMAEIQVHRFGARVVTADGVGNGDDPGSRLMKDVALAAARFERSMIAARTKGALAVKKSRGESTGTPPYGWRVAEDGKKLAEDPREQEVLRGLQELRARGWPYRQIREKATQRNWMSRARKPFTLQAVFQMTRAVAVNDASKANAYAGRARLDGGRSLHDCRRCRRSVIVRSIHAAVRANGSDHKDLHANAGSYRS